MVSLEDPHPINKAEYDYYKAEALGEELQKRGLYTLICALGHTAQQDTVLTIYASFSAEVLGLHTEEVKDTFSLRLQPSFKVLRPDLTLQHATLELDLNADNTLQFPPDGIYIEEFRVAEGFLVEYISRMDFGVEDLAA